MQNYIFYKTNEKELKEEKLVWNERILFVAVNFPTAHTQILKNKFQFSFLDFKNLNFQIQKGETIF